MGTQPGLPDYHLKNARLELTVTVKVEFDEFDYLAMESILPVKVSAPHNLVRAALRLLLPSCEVSSTHSSRQRTVSWKSNTRLAQGNFLRSDSPAGLADPPSAVLSLDAFIEQLRSVPSAKDLNALLLKAGLDPSKTAIGFGSEVANLLANVVAPRIGVFDEVRLRPRGRGQSVLQSYDGSLVSDVLHTLKNGNREQRGKYGANSASL